MRRETGRIILGGALGVLAMLVANRYVLHLDAPRPAQAKLRAAEYLERVELVGVEPRDFDPATRGARRDGDAWVLDDVDLDVARALAEAPQELDHLAGEDPRWVPMQTWKLRSGGASDFAIAREHCAWRHAGDDLCHARLSVVVQRDGRQDGRVVFVKPMLEAHATDACRAFTDCIASQAWLGREAPLPAHDSEDTYAFVAGETVIGDGEVPASRKSWQADLEASLAETRDNLTALRSDQHDQRDPITIQNITLQQDRLENTEWLLGAIAD